MTEPTSKPATPTTAAPRRSFLRRALAVVIGGVTGIVPALVGLASFLNPLRPSVQDKHRPTFFDAEGFCKVTSWVSLARGAPVRCPIIADRKDAWTTLPAEPIGAVYVQKVGEDQLRTFSATCPHLGCSVDYKVYKQGYLCPCHNSLFDGNGKRSASSPSARDLDRLECKVQDGEVWVKFQKFKTGTKQKHAQ